MHAHARISYGLFPFFGAVSVRFFFLLFCVRKKKEKNRKNKIERAASRRRVPVACVGMQGCCRAVTFFPFSSDVPIRAAKKNCAGATYPAGRSARKDPALGTRLSRAGDAQDPWGFSGPSRGTLESMHRRDALGRPKGGDRTCACLCGFLKTLLFRSFSVGDRQGSSLLAYSPRILKGSKESHKKVKERIKSVYSRLFRLLGKCRQWTWPSPRAPAIFLQTKQQQPWTLFRVLR